LFDALRGAGAVFAPRLLVAFGEQRERFTSAAELQKYAGIAPVTERRGKKSWVHWRFQCPTFLRQTFVEWAAESIRHAFWARVSDQQQRDVGKAHQAAARWRSSGSACSSGVGRIARRTMNPSISLRSTAVGHP
jgi:hypothetical protein